MTTRPPPDPYLLGANGPELRIPAHLAVILWPTIVRFVNEHHAQGATAKLQALKPLLYRWEHLVELHRMTPERFASEPPDGGRPAAVGLSNGMAGSSGWLTASQAADRLGITPTQVARLARGGHLDGNKPGREWQIEEASVDAYAAARRTA